MPVPYEHKSFKLPESEKHYCEEWSISAGGSGQPTGWKTEHAPVTRSRSTSTTGRRAVRDMSPGEQHISEMRRLEAATGRGDEATISV